MPLPEGRPYSLGNSSADVASINATSEISASRSTRSAGRAIENRHAVSYDSDGSYVRPTAAYAPAPRDEIGSLLSARGLY